MDSLQVRQLTVAVSPQLAALSLGGCISYPTVLLQQLRANESSIPIDIHTASWIGSIYGVSGIPVVFLPFIMQWKGRKISYIITCMFLVIGWILSITATNVDLILASESFHGLGTNSLLPVAFLSMTEMLAPKYRYIAMQIFGISGALGMCSTGILGRYLHYKTISIIMFVPAAVAMGIAFFWVESPPWLACKGEFKKCEEAFLWLRGRDDPSMKELKELITAQKENLSRSRSKPRMSWNSFWEQVTSRDFYTPSLHIFVLLNMMYWSGGDVVLIYFIEIVQKTTQNQDATFYASIAMYCIYFLGAVTTNITVRKFKNKTVLLASASGVIMCLLSASIVTFLQSLGTLAKDSILCMFCLLGFMMCNCLGLNAVVFYIAAELMPVRHRSIGGALFIIFNCGLYASTQKTSPYMFLYIDMWGTFMIYTVNAIICSLFVWKYVPETKGKTLQEIEDFYIHGTFIKRNILDEVVSIDDHCGTAVE